MLSDKKLVGIASLKLIPGENRLPQIIYQFDWAWSHRRSVVIKPASLRHRCLVSPEHGTGRQPNSHW